MIERVAALRLVDREFEHEILEKVSRLEGIALLISAAIALHGDWWMRATVWQQLKEHLRQTAQRARPILP